MSSTINSKCGLALVSATGIAAIIIIAASVQYNNVYLAELTERLSASAVAAVPNPWWYQFKINGTLAETENETLATSPYWYLNSGGYMILKNGIGSTYIGDLPLTNKWAILYKISSALDTDGGIHPQNLFRLITRSKWENYTQEVYFNTLKLNLSASEQRNVWSGLLLFNRYQDQDNLYYAGIRDDGHAVIKSKKGGVYTTLAEKPIISGIYNRITNPTLLPLNEWVGLKTEVKNLPDNTVSIKLYTDIGKTGTWKEVLSVIDRSHPILEAGYTGIRTDFRDVQFDDFKMTKI